ncbi:MAG: hypothetical protein LBG58_10590, partial [Planctomycetaceae bacterium]|nr:hypothetical protein [Planctomycetaceae bacterium]
MFKIDSYVETSSVTSAGNVTVTSVTSAQSSAQTSVSPETATTNQTIVCVPNPVSVRIPFVSAGMVK